MYHAGEICENIRNCLTLLSCMILVIYVVRTGLFGECNVAGEITN